MEYNNLKKIPEMFDNSCHFEPTFFLRDSNISVLMPSLQRVDGRDSGEVAHLALLGLKIQEPAFWVYKQIIKAVVRLLLFGKKCACY